MMARSKSPAQKAHAAREKARLRRIARAQELAVGLLDGVCAGYPELWNSVEIAHRRATTPVSAADAAGLALELCVGCPVIDRCRSWAKTDQYTGLAAGLAWEDGVPQDVPVPYLVGAA